MTDIDTYLPGVCTRCGQAKVVLAGSTGHTVGGRGSRLTSRIEVRLCAPCLELAPPSNLVVETELDGQGREASRG